MRTIQDIHLKTLTILYHKPSLAIIILYFPKK